METEEIFDTTMEFVSLVFFEIVLSFLAVILILISIFCFAFNHYIIGIILDLIAIFSIVCLVRGIKIYVKGGI